jgi:hypothetical protein
VFQDALAAHARDALEIDDDEAAARFQRLADRPQYDLRVLEMMVDVAG